MKKFMKSLLITGICASILTSGLVFADTTTQTKFGHEQGMNPPTGDRPVQERMEGQERMPRQERFTDEEKELREEEHAKRQEELLTIVDTYASDLSDDFEDAFATEAELQQEMHDLREANKPSDEEMEAMKEKMDSIRAQVESGELTKEEARELMDANRPERPENDNPKEQMTQEEHEALRLEQQQKGDTFKAALDAEDEDTIVDMLNEMLEKLNERNEELAERIANM